MARKKTPRRIIQGDPRYNNVKIARLINYVMQSGEKNLATRIVYRSLNIIKEKTKSDPQEIFDKAAEFVTPNVEVRARRFGGANLQIPTEVRTNRRFQLFLRWMVQAAAGRKEKTMAERLAQEFMNAANGEGAAVKKRVNMDRTALSHRAYAHLK